jgi:hypothetical protein
MQVDYRVLENKDFVVKISKGGAILAHDESFAKSEQWYFITESYRWY